MTDTSITLTEKFEEPVGADSQPDSVAQRPKKTKFRKFGSFCWALMIIGLIILFGFQLGFFIRYVVLVTKPAPELTEKVDGIVVLTGGQNRLKTAMHLLDRQSGRRLLITGVNPALSHESLKSIMTANDKLFACCVDVDKSALNTIGNALATKDWAKENAISSLIVVTGAFHMPRALKELRHALGDVRLIAYPVNVPQGHNWWRDHSRLRDLLREYIKLMAVSLRDHLNTFSNRSWPYMPFYQKASIDMTADIKRGSL